MAQRSGDELTELEGRQEPRLVKALEMVAPGTALREGIDNILHGRTGGLIVVGDPEELSFLFSGGIKLDIDYTPALLYHRQDGRWMVLNERYGITIANVQLMPDPTILHETGTRHRTAERSADRCQIAISSVASRPSRRREVHPRGHPLCWLANQALATLDKYRTRLTRSPAPHRPRVEGGASARRPDGPQRPSS
jgi:diadenylate cyclase